MIIIIGLGNPGEKFKNTKHNIGFQVVDKIADNFQFSIFNFQSKFNAQISQGEFAGEKIILVKPQTFMNDSGKSVQKIVSSFRSQVSSLVVVHDDIDLPIGKIKIVKDRGSAGHKGVESIIKAIGNENLVRFRVGIAKIAEQNAPQTKTQAINVVLENFSASEKEIINSVVTKTAQALNYYLINGLEKTMNEYN